MFWIPNTILRVWAFKAEWRPNQRQGLIADLRKYALTERDCDALDLLDDNGVNEDESVGELIQKLLTLHAEPQSFEKEWWRLPKLDGDIRKYSLEKADVVSPVIVGLWVLRAALRLAATAKWA